MPQHGEAERAASAFFAFYADLASVRLDYLLHYRKSQSAAAVPTGAVNLVESLEDVRQVLSRYARAGVPHIDRVTALATHDGDIYATRVCILHRIVQKVHQHLPELISVAQRNCR